MKFRKKPIIVDAVQYTGPVTVKVGDPLPTTPGVLWVRSGEIRTPHVRTTNGATVPVRTGDWIIAEGDGVNHYPCDPQVFEQTYEKI